MGQDQWTQQIETQKDSTGTSRLSRTYAATLGEIITKSNVGRQQLEPQQTATAIGIFYEVCFGHIPEHRLNDCYKHVLRTRHNTFPLKPEELCTAWDEIRQSEMHKRALESRQLTYGFCGRCNNTGTELIRDANAKVKGARPCRH